MMIIPLTRNSYCCLNCCSVFGPKFGSFRGDYLFMTVKIFFYEALHIKLCPKIKIVER